MIRILVTGGGAPGIKGTIFSLRNNSVCENVFIAVTDVKEDCAGKYLADEFFVIAHSRDKENYLQQILDISKQHKIDVIIPQNTLELEVLSEHINIFEKNQIKVAVSEYNSLLLVNNKFNLTQLAKKLNIPVPATYIVSTFNDLVKYAKELGWPDKRVLIKPPKSNGSRGLRIIDEQLNYLNQFYNEKPNNIFTKMEILHSILGDKFPELMITEFIEGDEITVDAFRYSSNEIFIPRIRKQILNGISFINEYYESDEIIHYSKILSESVDLKYAFGFQFIIDKNKVPYLIECNPRIQGTMVFSTLAGCNLIYATVNALLNKRIPDFNLNKNTKLYRYWGAIGINDKMIIV
ncbi:ATP-grasp domain-containing protein [Rosettibacter firmus]|uniref:ATP-grasp domain-containing protein n=1 Tax=Rosettibacter firmus TaxID=3111522 RepID=UPI00336BFE7C